jgi:hypothetical protein
MCDFNPRNGGRRVDPCMRGLIAYLNSHGIETISCCCGHGVYPMSIIVREADGTVRDICSGATIRRRKRFYRTDLVGLYFVPEAVR